MMHPENCFITLTYSDENLRSDRLQYEDFQKFMKRLRFAYPNRQIGVFVTGEYGDKTKRPHWHACVFGWQPPDAKHKYTSDRGDRVSSSESLEKIWGLGIAEFGTVTFESAGYCARYAAKKLIHGNDDEHDFQPISKKSSKNAIGKKFLEKYWPSIFSRGSIVLPNGSQCSIPRYYEKWLKQHQPEAWALYVTETKLEIEIRARERAEKEKTLEQHANKTRLPHSDVRVTRNQAREKILKQKFDKLQEQLKL